MTEATMKGTNQRLLGGSKYEAATQQISGEISQQNISVVESNNGHTVRQRMWFWSHLRATVQAIATDGRCNCTWVPREFKGSKRQPEPSSLRR